MIYDEKQNKAEFVITPWLNDDELTEHNQRNAGLRVAIVKQTKKNFKITQSQMKKSLRMAKINLKKRVARKVAKMSNERDTSKLTKMKNDGGVSDGEKN